ncbi:MAG TPA: tetratricopeptide repeat protein [Candidatus Sulfotelmatobacter sp.]
MRAETRHQLKQDAFSRVTLATAEKTAHWTVEHRTPLLIVGAILVVVLGTVFGGWYYLSTQDEKASFDFAIAVRTMEAQLRPAGSPEQPDVPSFTSAKERAEAAHKQFQAIADKYPHTRTADMAHYFLGVTAVDTGDNAAAERDLKQVGSSGNRELASLAKLALASLYGDTGRVKEAVALYQELMKKPTRSVSKVAAQLQLAELYENSKQPQDAKRTYEEIKKENPVGEVAQMVTQKLADLK